MIKAGSDITLHRAAWVLPIERPPIGDGAVLVKGRRIVGVGAYRDLRAQMPPEAKVVDHQDAALMPAVVNAHTHLELTGMEGKISLPQAGFPPWVQEVFRHRASMDSQALQEGMRRGLDMLTWEGTCLCGDITNTAAMLDDGRRHPARRGIDSAGHNTPQPLSRRESRGGCSPENNTDRALVCRQAFLELIGFDCSSLAAALERAGDGVDAAGAIERDGISLAAHATYSTSAAVIEQAKEWCRSRGRIFSIHVAEHAEEIELLQTGTGYCRELLHAVGRWVDGWVPPAKSPVAYLDSLGVLDEHTLLVHAVHMTDSDWEAITRRRCAVCFCPRSNHYVSTGRADLERAIQAGVRVALGTDSLASNSDLNLFSEAAFCLDQYPGLSPDAALCMMTLGGARALGRQDHFGSLAVGKVAAMIAVPADAGVPAAQLSETIIHKAKEGALAWALDPKNA